MGIETTVFVPSQARGQQRPVMLLSMQPQAATAAPSESRSFAGLLEEIAATPGKFPPARDLDGLADDTATFSYEHALRARARYLSANANPTSQPEPQRGWKLSTDVRQKPKQPDAGLDPASQHAAAQSHRDRKRASVTVRLSVDESEQLRERAAEAGISVSAYLRSCAFEVETLRAQVKATLAQLKSAPAQTVVVASRKPARQAWWRSVFDGGKRDQTPE